MLVFFRKTPEGWEHCLTQLILWWLEGHRYPWVPSQVRLQFQISFLRNIKIGCPCITYSLYPHITLTPNITLLVFIYIFSIFKDHVVMSRGNKSSNRMLDTSKNREQQRTRSKKWGATLNQTVSCKQMGSYIETKQCLVTVLIASSFIESSHLN